jgi:hypothetical protein
MLIVKQFHQAEIGEVRLLVRVQKNVGRLDIAMQNS